MRGSSATPSGRTRLASGFRWVRSRRLRAPASLHRSAGPELSVRHRPRARGPARSDRGSRHGGTAPVAHQSGFTSVGSASRCRDSTLQWCRPAAACASCVAFRQALTVLFITSGLVLLIASREPGEPPARARRSRSGGDSRGARRDYAAVDPAVVDRRHRARVLGGIAAIGIAAAGTSTLIDAGVSGRRVTSPST